MDESSSLERCPPAVALAFEFVEVCLQQQRSALVASDDDGERIEASDTVTFNIPGQSLEVSEMLPKQGAAFDMACNLLGKYFQQELDSLSPTPVEE